MLRLGPQVIPRSRELFLVVFTVYYLCNLVVASFSIPSLSTAFMTALLDVVFLLGMIYLLLKIVNYPGRWLQTVTACSGTGIIINLCAILLLLFSQHASANSSLEAVLSLLFLLLVGWSIIIMAHILRHAMEVSMGIGIIISVGMVWLSAMLVLLFMPEQTTL